MSSVGSTHAGGSELDPAIVARADVVVVEQRDSAFAPLPAGAPELEPRGRDGVVELGEIVAGTGDGRSSGEQITLYKSVGVAVQDLAAAALVLAAARERGVGQEIELEEITHEHNDFSPGLEGVVAVETEIMEPDREGGTLRYRGVDVEPLIGAVPLREHLGPARRRRHRLADAAAASRSSPSGMTGSAPADLQAQTARLSRPVGARQAQRDLRRPGAARISAASPAR